MVQSIRRWGVGVFALLLALTSTAAPATAQYYGSGYYPYGSYYGSGYSPYSSYYGSGYYGTGNNPYGSYYGGNYPYSSYYGSSYGYNPYASSYYNAYNPYGSYYGSSYYNNYSPTTYYGNSYGYPYNSYYGNSAYGASYGYNPYGPYSNYPYGYTPYGYSPYYNYNNTCTGYANPNGISGCNTTAATVSINDGPPGYFSPATITARVGQTVTWTNNGPTNSHTATSTSNLWNTGILAPGQSGSYTFTTVGTYSYTCTLHGHSGTVIVTN